MFLKRVHEISNIGRFCNCKGIAGIEFAPSTIIFANNGNGKSTFTSILRSFQTGNNNILIGKKTLGSGDSKKIHIDFEDDGKALPARFENKKWTCPPNERVFIFDTKFIAENVYDGEKIGDDHRANMHRVVIGAEGKKYAEAINDLMAKIKKCEQNKKEFTAQYSGAVFSRVFTLAQFITISKDENILGRIAEKKQEIQFANQLNKPADLKLQSPDIPTITIVLEKKIDSLHSDVEKKVKEHIEEHTSTPSTALPTLNAVNNVRKGGSCPFCGQDTSSVSDLMDAYGVFFDKSYQELQIEIAAVLKLFSLWDVDKTLKILLEEVEAWHAILVNPVIYDNLKREIENTTLKLDKIDLHAEIEKKSKDFNYKVPEEKIKEVSSSIEKINNAIAVYNSAIAAFKARVSSKGLEELQNELLRLEAIRDRHTLKWDTFCEEYKKNEENNKTYKGERDKAIEDLSIYSKATFATYQISINSVLTKVGADFKIKDLSEQKDLRKSEAIICGFDLEFFGKHTVGIMDTEDKPHFKNTLSEGDKSSLAFALFISILSHIEDLKDCLVVFDDPISSFDADRKKATAKLLFSLINKKGDHPAQTIVLTHESNFLIRLEKEFGREALYLKIVSDGLCGVIKQSTIERLNVYEDFLKPEAFEALDKMQKYLDGTEQVSKKSHKDCRIILENALKAKYYLELKADISKHTGITGYVKTLVANSLMPQSLANEFSKLLPDIHEPHHSSAEASIQSNSDGDIKDIIRTSLELLKKL